jgi:UDP-glucose 4-epimerase
MAVCLVTGGADFIGSHLVEALVARDHVVRVLDSSNRGPLSNLEEVRHRIEFISGDLTDYSLVREATRGVELVFHQALLVPQGDSVAHIVAAQKTYTTGILHILTAAREAEVKRVVYASSSRVYGEAAPRPLRENDPTFPSSPYAVMELTGEQHCAAFTCLYGLDTVRLRYFNVFGPRQTATSPSSPVVLSVLKAMLAGQGPAVHGSGLEPHDVLYIDDVVHANLLAAAAPRVAGKVYNIARGRPTTALEVVATVNKILGTDLRPTHTDFPRPDGFLYNQADVSRAEIDLGFCPCTDLEWGLRRCIHYYTERRDELTCPGNAGGPWN